MTPAETASLREEARVARDAEETPAPKRKQQPGHVRLGGCGMNLYVGCSQRPGQYRCYTRVAAPVAKELRNQSAESELMFSSECDG